MSYFKLNAVTFEVTFTTDEWVMVCKYLESVCLSKTKRCKKVNDTAPRELLKQVAKHVGYSDLGDEHYENYLKRSRSKGE